MKLGDVLSGHFDRKKHLTFRTSALGRCHRSLQYGVLGFPQEKASEKTRLMWKDRLEDEYRIVSKLKKKYKLRHTGDNHLTFRRHLVDLKCVISGTPDGEVKEEKEWIPLEIKSLNPFRFNVINNPEDLSREYFLQVQGEMLVTGTERALYVIGNSKTKKEFKELIIGFDDRVTKWIGERIKYIMGYINRKEIIYPEYLPGSKKCVWCLYKERCKKDVYKIPKIGYTESIKIKRGDYDYDQAFRIGRAIVSFLDQLDDLKEQIGSTVLEAKDFLLKKQIRKFSAGSTEVSVKDIAKLEGRIR